MQVHISTKPVRQASSVRGVGIYIRQLVRALTKAYPADTYALSSDRHVQADLVHYPYFEPFFLTLPLTHTTPIVVTIHDLIPLKYPKHFPPGLRGWLKWQIQKQALLRADHIITDSDSSAHDIKHILQYPPSRISVIPLAPGVARTTAKMKNAVASEYHLPARFALYVGDINWNKNIPGLINEFARLNNSSLHLVLVGQAFTALAPTPELTSITSAIAKSGRAGKIHLIGYVPSHHLPAIYGLATVYIQPSWDEGFGLTVLEAMAAGCPVLSSNRGSLPEVGGEAVVYFNPSNPGDLAHKLADLIASTPQRTKLIEQGRNHLKQFSWDLTARLTHAVYEKVLADH